MIKKIKNMKIRLIFYFSFFISMTFAQNENIGFESGNTSNWVCGSGSFGDTTTTLCNAPRLPIVIDYNGNCLNQGGINGTNTPTDPGNNRHTIMTTGIIDPHSNNMVNCVAPANLFPGNRNSFSFRLGNALTLKHGPPIISKAFAQAEGIKFKLQINSANTLLTYLYSVFFRESVPANDNHQDGRFIIKVTDEKDSLIANTYHEIVSTDSTLKKGALISGGPASTQYLYSEWKKTTIDLSAYIGQTITLEFITSDCFYWFSDNLNPQKCYYTPGEHATYAYLDLYVDSLITDLGKLTDNNISIDLYPNPMRSEMNLQIAGLQDEGSAELKIFDITGRMVYVQKVKNGKQQIAMDQIASGIYFIEIIERGIILQKKKISIVD